MLDDTAEGDWRVVSFTVDSRGGVGIRFGDGSEEMEAAGGKGSCGVDHAANGWAAAVTKGGSQLESDVWECCLDLHREGAAGRGLKYWNWDADHENSWPTNGGRSRAG